MRRYQRVGSITTKSVVLSTEQESALRRIAEDEGVSFSTVVREAVDVFLSVRRVNRRGALPDDNTLATGAE